MEDVTAGEVRSRTFRQALRGFDQNEVTSYLGSVANYLEALQQQLHLAGLTEVDSPHDLAAEYQAVGEEVTRVLEEARSAADTMRARAAADASRWRSETEEATQAARAAAWETGTEMLEQVMAECEALVREAEDAALRLRAQAERDSARLLTDAQREREELTRAGREEGEKIVSAARKEADGLLMGARHQADVAQERTRALEERRAELMDELESAQKALLGLEDDPGAVEPIEEANAPAKEPEATRSHWPEDDGVVRIVAARPRVPAETVDADALAAEVEAMREQSAPEPLLDSPPRDDVVATKPLPHSLPQEEVVAAEALAEAAKGTAPEEVVEAEGMPEPESLPDSETTDQVVAAEALAEVARKTASEEVVEPEEVPAPQPDPLAGLFDELRTPEEPVPVVAESPNGEAESTEVAAVAVAVDAAPEEASDQALDTRQATGDSVDPFALRDRLLLPVQNRALRLVKRQLVAAQNQALEELRLDPDWVPGDGMMDGEIAAVLVELVEESGAAGIAAAAELLSRTDGARPEFEMHDPSPGFTAAFIDAATLSLERSRSAGAGKRETSSSLSRVFRAWRTDDAERRVRFISRDAYHTGLLAALGAMDCDRVMVVTEGRSCADHGDAPEHWLIADGPPPGSLVPPASLECSCAVIPDC